MVAGGHLPRESPGTGPFMSLGVSNDLTRLPLRVNWKHVEIDATDAGWQRRTTHRPSRRPAYGERTLPRQRQRRADTAHAMSPLRGDIM